MLLSFFTRVCDFLTQFIMFINFGTTETTSPLETLFYISNRNTANTSPNGDSIIIVSATFEPPSPTPKIEKIFTIDTGLNQIRGMELSATISSVSSESDDNEVVGYLAAAGEYGGGVKIFARTDGGRKLVPVAGFGVDGFEDLQPTGARNVTTFLWL